MIPTVGHTPEIYTAARQQQKEGLMPGRIESYHAAMGAAATVPFWRIKLKQLLGKTDDSKEEETKSS